MAPHFTQSKSRNPLKILRTVQDLALSSFSSHLPWAHHSSHRGVLALFQICQAETFLLRLPLLGIFFPWHIHINCPVSLTLFGRLLTRPSDITLKYSALLSVKELSLFDIHKYLFLCCTDSLTREDPIVFVLIRTSSTTPWQVRYLLV